MTIVASDGTLRNFGDLAVPLPRYAQIVQYRECAFFGVSHERNDKYAFQPVLTRREREWIGRSLREGQQELAELIGTSIGVTWHIDEVPIRNPVFGRAKLAVEPGVRAATTIEAGASIDRTNDPGVVVIAGVTFTDPNEVHVYYPGTDVEISPSAVDITAGTLTISIPRCRTVTEEAQDSVNEDTRVGVNYSDLDNFLDEVDVVRVYNDPSTNAILVRGTCTNPACSEETTTACMYLKNARQGSWRLRAATYSGGAWAASGSMCGCAEKVRLYYRAGIAVDEHVEDAMIRLAHSKLPNEVCGIQYLNYVWARDRAIPETVSRERYNCPFGMADGAWTAYKFGLAMRVIRGRELGQGRRI